MRLVLATIASQTSDELRVRRLQGEPACGAHQPLYHGGVRATGAAVTAPCVHVHHRLVPVRGGDGGAEGLCEAVPQPAARERAGGAHDVRHHGAGTLRVRMRVRTRPRRCVPVCLLLLVFPLPVMQIHELTSGDVPKSYVFKGTKDYDPVQVCPVSLSM